MGYSRVVHQDVDGPVLKYVVENGLHIVVPGYVAAICFRMAAGGNNLRGQGLSGFIINIQNTDASSPSGKFRGNCTSNSAGCARDHSQLAIQAKTSCIVFQKNLRSQRLFHLPCDTRARSSVAKAFCTRGKPSALPG